MMTSVPVIIWGTWFLFALSAMWALGWALRNREFATLREQRDQIFDEAEPVGRMTDRFPDGPCRGEAR